MQTIAFKYHATAPRKLLLPFICCEAVTIVAALFFSYKFLFLLLFLLVVPVFLHLDIKTNLVLLIAASTFVSYKNTTWLAYGIAVILCTLALTLFNVYSRYCLTGLKVIKDKVNPQLAIFILIVLANSVRGLFHSYKITYWGLETFAYLSFGLAFLIPIFFVSSKNIRRYFNALIILANCLAVYGILKFLSVGHRIGGTIFGIVPSMIAVVLLNLFFYSKSKRRRLLYLLFAFLPILHLLFSFTRGYWVGFLASLTISYMFYVIQLEESLVKRFLRFLRGATIASIALFLLMVILQVMLPGGDFVSTVAKRFRSGFSLAYGKETLSNYQRYMEYQGAIDKIKENPILGYGIGYGFEFRDWLARKTYVVRAVHNDYLAIVLKMGLFGLLIFLWLFYVFFKTGRETCRRQKHEYFKGMSAGFTANVLQLLIIGFTNHVFIEIMNAFYLAFAMGVVWAIRTSQKSLQRG